MIYNLIIEINIKEQYFIKSILSIFNHKIKEYHNMKENLYQNLFFENYKITWLCKNDKLNLYNTETDYNYNIVYDDTLKLINNLELYIKNIFPEFGNKWNASFTINKTNCQYQ
jgi:hypothetical protein